MRRGFATCLGAALLLGGWLPACAPVNPPPKPPFDGPRLSLAAGDVTADGIVLWAQPVVAGTVTIRLSSDPTFTAILRKDGLPGSPLAPAKVEWSGLSPQTRYYYDAVDASGARAVGQFVTAAIEGFQGLRFGVSGDWRGELAPYPAISNAPPQSLDFFVALGDTMYADFESPALPDRVAIALDELLRKHSEVYVPRLGVASLADLRATTAWFAVIDDHEIVNDFSGGASLGSDPRFAGGPGVFINDSARFLNGILAFEAFHPLRAERYGDVPDARTRGKPKLYRARQFGRDAAMFLVDARSFRDAPIASRLLDAEGFYADAFAAERTMLGATQFADLQADLLAAEVAGVTWKLVLLPEPIQNLGPVLGEDRYEGYSWERTQLLRFIQEHAIRNVVFIAADIHCTIINDLSYQDEPGGAQIAVDSWEISTGAVAFAAPFGPTAVESVRATPVLGPLFGLLYDGLDRAGKDRLLTATLDYALDQWGFDTIGLNDARIGATLLQGEWASLHTYGWTLFEIDADSQGLTVTTFGVDWYDEAELSRAPRETASRSPMIVSQFRVQPAR